MSKFLCSFTYFVGLATLVLTEPPFDHCLCRGEFLDCSHRWRRPSYHVQQIRRGNQIQENRYNSSHSNAQISESQNEDRPDTSEPNEYPYIDIPSLCPSATEVHLQDLDLQQFPDGLQNITKIDVSSNRLTTLPEASLLGGSIKYLDLSTNEIANASKELRHLEELEELRIGWNRLTHLRFLPSPCGLRRIDARVNYITSVEGPLRQCNRLISLFLFATNVSELPDDALSGMLELREMILNDNPITSLSERSFTGLPNLEILDLRYSLLTSLPNRVFAELRRLQDLKLDENPFESLPGQTFEGLTELRSLFLTRALRNLTSLSDGLFSPLTNLRELYLDDNDLTSLPENVFRGLQHLETLHLGKNDLQLIPENAFTSLGNLRMLRLNRNNLTTLPDSLFSDLRSLRHVDASFNSLTTLPGLGACCASLESATFINNSVAAPSESSLRALLGGSGSGRDVDLQENPIHASALRWVLPATDVEPFVNRDGCGGLRLGGSVLRFCVDAPAVFPNWVAAVRAVND